MQASVNLCLLATRSRPIVACCSVTDAPTYNGLGVVAMNSVWQPLVSNKVYAIIIMPKAMLVINSLFRQLSLQYQLRVLHPHVHEHHSKH